MTTNTSVERIEITAHVDGATRGLWQVGAALGSLRTGADAVKGALGAVGVTLSVGAMAAYAAEIIKATGALGNMATAAGSTVENLSRVQAVAKIGGHDFGGLTAAIGTMIKGLKGADEEGQAASHALEFLGIAAKNANGSFRDSVEILEDVAKALAQYEDGGDKVALTQDLLGKGAQKYLPLLKDIAEQGLGAAKVTKQQAEEADKLEKNIRRLTMSLEDAKRAVLLDMVPAMDALVQRLIKANEEGGKFGLVVQGWREAAGSGLLGIGGWLAEKGLGAIEGLSPNKKGGPDLWATAGLGANWRGVPSGFVGDTGMPQPFELKYVPSPKKEKKEGDGGAELLLSLQDQLAAAYARTGEHASVFDSVMRKLTEGTKQYSHEVQATALALAGEIDMAKKAKDAAEARKKLDMEIMRERNQFLEQQHKSIEQAEEELRKERERIEEIGLSADALVRLKEARVDDMIAAQERDIMASRAGETDEAYTRILERQLEVLKARRTLVGQEAAKNAQVEAAKKANEEWQRTADSIERSLTDALTTPWDRSVSFAQRARDAIVSMFQRMVLEPVLRPVIQQAAGSITNMLVPQAARSIGGFPGGGFDLSGLFGGGSSGFLASGASVGAFGEVAGLTAMTEAAALGGAGAVAGGAGVASLLGPAGIALGALSLFGGDLFGGGGAPKPTQLGVLRTSGGFHVSQNDFSGAGVTALPGFALLNAMLNDPTHYDPEVLAQHLGYFEGAPGESADAMWQKLLQKIEPARRAAEQKQEEALQAQKAAAKAMEDAAAALEAVQREEARVAAGLSDAVRGLSGRLGIDTLQGAVGGLATSEYRSPMDRLNAARGIFDSTYAQALGGDLGAVQALPGAAQSLLGIGRSAFASGGGFQNLFVETNRALNDVLSRQREVQNDLLRGVSISILQAGAETNATLVREFGEMKTQLELLRGEVRRLAA